MADYAGAELAIRQRLEENWLTTRITYQNETPTEPWPPTDGDSILQPWVNLEIECFGSRIMGQGLPGNRVYKYDGLISVHVFTPIDSGAEDGKALAVAVGELFRRKKFYDTEPGICVRTEDPYPAGGSSTSDDGIWFGTTMTCAFAYWHRG